MSVAKNTCEKSKYISTVFGDVKYSGENEAGFWSYWWGGSSGECLANLNWAVKEGLSQNVILEMVQAENSGTSLR